MLRHQTKTFAGLVTLACTAALLSLPTESVGQDIGHRDNSKDSYTKVIEYIQQNWADMRGGWNDQQNQDYLTLSGFNAPSHFRKAGAAGNAKDQVLVQYNFNAQDKIFGVGGTHSVLDGSKPHLPGLINIDNNYTPSGTVPIGTADGVNAGSTPWLSKAGALKDYLNNRKDQWEPGLEIMPYFDGSVFQRAAQVSGMGYDAVNPYDSSIPVKRFGYANNYIVEMWVDKDAIFRPNLHQSVDTTQAGSFEAVWDNHSKTYAPNTTKDPWLSGLNGQMLDGNGVEITSFGKSSTGGPGFYDMWWKDSYDKPNFPWTGIGYTYDWYYQNLDANGDPLNKNWKDYWDKTDHGFGYGQGLAEYVLLQSKKHAKPINFDIVNVQTTYQYMDGKNGAWGNVSAFVPEPTSLTIFGMAALAGLGMHRRRRR